MLHVMSLHFFKYCECVYVPVYHFLEAKFTQAKCTFLLLVMKSWIPM